MTTTLADRLISWAQNEEMVDAGYTAHGHDCNAAAMALDVMRDVVHAMADYLEADESVHAVWLRGLADSALDLPSE